MNPTNILFTHLTSAAILAYVLRLLQKWEKIPWITKDTTKANAIARLILSTASTIGITTAWSAGTAGEHTLTIVIPAVSVLGHGLWQLAGQYVFQHGWLNVLAIGDPVTSVVSVAIPKQP